MHESETVDRPSCAFSNEVFSQSGADGVAPAASCQYDASPALDFPADDSPISTSSSYRSHQLDAFIQDTTPTQPSPNAMLTDAQSNGMPSHERYQDPAAETSANPQEQDFGNPRFSRDSPTAIIAVPDDIVVKPIIRDESSSTSGRRVGFVSADLYPVQIINSDSPVREVYEKPDKKNQAILRNIAYTTRSMRAKLEGACDRDPKEERKFNKAKNKQHKKLSKGKSRKHDTDSGRRTVHVEVHDSADSTRNGKTSRPINRHNRGDLKPSMMQASIVTRDPPPQQDDFVNRIAAPCKQS